MLINNRKASKTNKSKIILVAFFLFALIFISKSYAQHQHKAHIHGTSNLAIAFENNILQIQLNTPLMDLVGFEGKPNTKTQKETLKNASETLKNWRKICTFDGGSCKEKKVSLTNELNNNKHSHKHKKNHSHKHKKHQKENNDIHSELKIFYEFDCTKFNKFSSIKIKLFEKFSRIQKVNAQWVNINGQGQMILDKKENLLTFR